MQLYLRLRRTVHCHGKNSRYLRSVALITDMAPSSIRGVRGEKALYRREVIKIMLIGFKERFFLTNQIEISEMNDVT